MTLQIRPTSDDVLVFRQRNELGTTEWLALGVEEQRELLDKLAGNFGMQLVSRGVMDRLLRKPVGAALRVARYLEGRRMHRNLDQELIHGVGVKQEDDTRDLLVSDLQALLDYVREG